MSGYLAYFHPGKTVPAFKYTDKGGRGQIMDKVAGVNIKRYYTGITHFIKLARDFKADILVIAPDSNADVPFRLYLNDKTSTVKKLEPGTYKLNLDDVVAAAALPVASDAFTVSTLEKSNFVRNGDEAGGSLQLA